MAPLRYPVCFYLAALLNHSCQPNAVVEFPFNSHELVVNARTRIAPGEQIVISYLDEVDVERSRHSRYMANVLNR